MATDFLHCGGGKAANVAYGGQRLGAPVMLIGRVGDDDLAEQALDRLRQQQIDLSLVLVVAARPAALSPS